MVDGHNLIPKIPGLGLDDLDDEEQLIQLLLKFCHRRGKQVEVFFDNAPPGGVRARNYGSVLARFVRQGTTADEAIRGRLVRLSRAARNWTVVSSDQEIQAAARAARAHYVSSEAFADALIQNLDDPQKDRGEKGEPLMEPEELKEWLRLFDSSEDD